jgi:hypothetical protein
MSTTSLVYQYTIYSYLQHHVYIIIQFIHIYNITCILICCRLDLCSEFKLCKYKTVLTRALHTTQYQPPPQHRGRIPHHGAVERVIRSQPQPPQTPTPTNPNPNLPKTQNPTPTPKPPKPQSQPQEISHRGCALIKYFIYLILHDNYTT